MTVKIDGLIKYYQGLSTDTKPSLGSADNGLFKETNSGDEYAWNGSAWVIKNHSLSSRVGEVQSSPTAYTLLARLKDLLTGVVLATSENHIGKTSGIIVPVAVTKVLVASGDYAQYDVLNNSDAGAWVFDGAARANGGKGYITKARIIYGKASGLTAVASPPRVSLLLFKTNPSTSMLTDNGLNTAPLFTDWDNYLGMIDFPAWENLNSSQSYTQKCTPSLPGGIPLSYECASDDDAIYGIPVLRDVFTEETAGASLMIKLTFEQY